jgi:hypothetical protein
MSIGRGACMPVNADAMKTMESRRHGNGRSGGATRQALNGDDVYNLHDDDTNWNDDESYAQHRPALRWKIPQICRSVLGGPTDGWSDRWPDWLDLGQLRVQIELEVPARVRYGQIWREQEESRRYLIIAFKLIFVCL